MAVKLKLTIIYPHSQNNMRFPIDYTSDSCTTKQSAYNSYIKVSSTVLNTKNKIKRFPGYRNEHLNSMVYTMFNKIENENACRSFYREKTKESNKIMLFGKKKVSINLP